MSNYKYTVILFASIDNWGYSINLRHAGTMQAGIDWSKICITLKVCSTYITVKVDWSELLCFAEMDTCIHFTKLFYVNKTCM